MLEKETTESISTGAEVADKKVSPKTIIGKVVSSSLDKGVLVEMERLIKHPVYSKFIKRTTKILVHDPDNSCNVGDFISIREIKPVSKRKSWQVVEVLN
jgi:small subunit ribosomal protein S17|tara:strand:+ start:21528 stop:21824 length:297 start_codon:yes stop_codon:yes gene_type:complete